MTRPPIEQIEKRLLAVCEKGRRYNWLEGITDPGVSTFLNDYSRDVKQLLEWIEVLENVVLLADKLSDCLNEFGDDPGCCSEWLEALDSALISSSKTGVAEQIKVAQTPGSVKS